MQYNTHISKQQLQAHIKRWVTNTQLNHRWTKHFISLLTLLLLTVAPTLAQAVYSNATNPGIANSTIISDVDFPNYGADDFVLTTSTTLTSVKWVGAYSGPTADPIPTTDNFTIEIYSDVAGAPGTLLSTFPVGNAVSREWTSFNIVIGISVYTYQATISFPATAGTTYWLLIHNDTTGEDRVWLWRADSGGNAKQSVSKPPTFSLSSKTYFSLFDGSEAPFTIDTQPVDIGFCPDYGDDATFTVATNGGAGPLDYHWIQDCSGTLTSLGKGSSFTFTAPTTADTACDYYVVITDAESCSLVSNTFNLEEFCCPIEIDTQPMASTLCEGETATFTAAASGATDLSYQWQQDCGGGFVNIGTDSPTLTINNASVADACSYQVIVSSVIEDCEVTSDVVALTVNTLPTANIPTINAVCFGENLVLNEDGGNAISWSWTTTGSGIFDDATLQSPTVSGAADGDMFTVTVTDANGCENSASVTVNVSTEITASVTPGNVTYCASDFAGGVEQTIFVVVNIIGGTGPYDIEINDPDNGIVPINNISVPYVYTTLTDGPGVYTLNSATDANGCTTTGSGLFEVLVFDPMANIPALNTICAGDDLLLNENAGDAISWAWTTSGSGSFDDATLQNPTVSGAANGDTFTVTITDMFGCENSSTVTASVNALPTANIPTLAPVCTGGDVVLNEDGGDAVSWAWTTTGTGTFDNATLQSPTVSGAADGDMFIVTVTDANGCENSSSTTVNISTEITASISGAVEFCAIDFAGGNQQIISFPITITGGIGPYDIDMNDPDLGIISISGASDGFIWSASADGAELYTLNAITDANGCSADVSGSFEVIVNPDPTANAIAAPICTGDDLVLNEDDGDAVTWSWTTTGSGTFDNPTLQSPTVTGAADGDLFTVFITDANGCAANSSTTVTINNSPVANFDDPVDICEDEGLVDLSALNATPVGGSFSGPGVVGLNFDPSLVGAGVYTITYNFTDGNNCTGSATQDIIVNASPAAPLEDGLVVCLGDDTSAGISAICTSTDPSTLNWYDTPNGTLQATGSPFDPTGTMAEEGAYDPTVAGTYTYYVVCELDNGCTSEPVAVVVQINDAPVISCGSSGQEGFLGNALPFWYNTEVITIEGGSGPYEVDMEKEGYVTWTVTPTNTGAEVTINYADNAEWCVSIMDANGCAAIAQAGQFDCCNDDGSGTGNPSIPGANGDNLDIDAMTISGESGVNNNDGSIELMIAGCSDGAGPTYQWAGPNGYTSTAPSATGLGAGLYYVTVSCDGEMTTGWYWVPLDRSGGRLKMGDTIPMGITTYPNPTIDQTTIEFRVENSGPAKVQLFSMDGQLIKELYQQEAESGNVYFLELNTTNLNAGTYIAIVTDAQGERAMNRIVVLK